MITRHSDFLSAFGPIGVITDYLNGLLVISGHNWKTRRRRKKRRRRRENGFGVLGTAWLIVVLVLGSLVKSVEGGRGYDKGYGGNSMIEHNRGTEPSLDSGSGSGSGPRDAITAVGATISVTDTAKASATMTATMTVTVSVAGNSTTGTCPKRPEGYVAGLGGILLSLHGQEQQCSVKPETGYWDPVGTPSSAPSFSSLSSVAPSADTTVSPSQATSSDTASDPNSSDSLLDAALFLSFEDWKKRNLEKAGQSPDHIGFSGRKGAGGVGGKKGEGGGSVAGVGYGKKTPGNNINNALDALGDDVEIEWNGFGGSDSGRVEGRKEPFSKHVDEGSGVKSGTLDTQMADINEGGGEGSGDTVAQDRAAVAPISGASTRSSSSREAGKTCKERFNYASFDCGATVLKTNAEGKSSSAVLIEHKDSYMLNECGAKETKFLIVELCADILVDTVVLANYEFFSSMFRTFRVSVSDRYPPPSSPSVSSQRDSGKEAKGTYSNSGDDSTIPKGMSDSEKDNLNSGNKNDKKDTGISKSKSDGWRELGIFQARNSRGIQVFAIENPLVWARYLRVEFLSHYGNEFYCPVSLLRVHGTTMMEEFRHQQEEAEREHESESEIVGNEEGDVDSTGGSTQDQIGMGSDAKSFVIETTKQDAVEVHALRENPAPEETSTEGGEKDSQIVIISSGGLANSPDGPYPTSSSTEASSTNISQQKQSVSQVMEVAQLDPNNTLALATLYSNLTIDQLLGMVNDHFKYNEHNDSDTSDEQIKNYASKGSDIAYVVADSGAESSVKSAAAVTPATMAASTTSASSGPSTSKDLSNAVDATNSFTGTIGNGSEAGTAHNDKDGYHTATRPTYESDTIMSSSTSITSTDASIHRPVSTPSTTPRSLASSSSTMSRPSVSISSPSSSSSSSSSIPSHSSSIASTSSSSTRPPSPNPTTQESFFKTVHKRLQMLESNSTLSLQYIEDQSRILRDAFLKVDKRQSIKIDEYLARLSENITEEVGRYRDQHDQLWHMISLELSTYRQEHQREIIALGSRLSILADELIFQQRVSIAQSVLLVLCFGLLLFSGTGRRYVAVESSSAVSLSGGAVTASASIFSFDALFQRQTLARSRKALWRWFTRSFLKRSDFAERMAKKDSIRNDIGSVDVFPNRSSRSNPSYFENSEPEKSGKDQSASDVDAGTHTPASTNNTDTPNNHVRELSPSKRGQFRFNEEIFSNGQNSNRGSARNTNKRQELQLDPLDGDKKEQDLLSPPIASPLLSPSSATIQLDETRETQSGPPTPSGRRSIA